MAVTGSDLNRHFDLQLDKAYTAYFDNPKKNRVFNNVLFRTIEEVLKKGAQQRYFDELSYLIKTEKSYSVLNNKIYTSKLVVSNITNVTTTVTVTTVLPHNLQTGDTATIADAAGITNVNGSFVITSTGTNTFTYTASIAPTGTYTAYSATLTSARYIDDYLHLLAMKCTFVNDLSLNISAATATDPVKVTVSSENNLRTGESITISGVTATGAISSLNDTWAILKKTTGLSFTVNLNGIGGYYQSGGSISRTVSKYAKPQTSDRKISELGEPTIYDPKFETAEKFLKIYPSDTCSTAVVDYISKPSVTVDVADATYDLSLVYPERFLYHVVDRAVTYCTKLIKDGELNQLETMQIVENP